MVKRIDMVGYEFSGCNVIHQAYKKNGKTYWECLCTCGNKFIAEGSNIRQGHTKSCGCLRSRYAKRKSHGQINTKLYSKWNSMKTRCNNPNHDSFINYGNKGIEVCEEWNNSFEKFYDWSIDSGYSEGLSLDRVDNSKGYYPENCRWVEFKEQGRNKTNNRLLTYKGKTLCLSEWAETMGLPDYVLRNRLNRGWSVEKSLTTPVKRK